MQYGPPGVSMEEARRIAAEHAARNVGHPDHIREFEGGQAAERKAEELRDIIADEHRRLSATKRNL